MRLVASAMGGPQAFKAAKSAIERKKRQKVEFAILLALAYFLIFGITIQKNFFK